MKAYVIEKGATSLASLRALQLPDPRPAAGQILVRMRAASLNYRDQAIVTGTYFAALARDTIALSDGAGEVVEIGPGVTRFRVGDRVATTFFRGWADGPPPGPLVALGNPADGVLSEYVVADQNDAVTLPPSLSFEAGSTLTCAGVTAWNALMVAAKIQAGQTVLVMGTGGVSIFALQLARAAGARVIATSSSDEKLARATRLGADVGINYTTKPDWEQGVLDATGGRGVDCVVEVGGMGTLGRSMRAVGYGGHIAMIGVLTGPGGDTAPYPLMIKGAHLHGIFVGSRAMLEGLCNAIETNRIQPVVDKVFGFDATPDAFRYQKSGAFGKVVITI